MHVLFDQSQSPNVRNSAKKGCRSRKEDGLQLTTDVDGNAQVIWFRKEAWSAMPFKEVVCVGVGCVKKKGGYRKA